MKKYTVSSIIKLLFSIFRFVPIKKNQIFLMVNEAAYDAKAICEYVENKYGYEKYKIIIGFANKKRLLYKNNKVLNVKTKSIRGAFFMMQSGTIIFSINPPRYLSYKKSQLLINTWHSYSYKKIGRDAEVFFDQGQIDDTTHFTSHSYSFTESVIRGGFNFRNEVLRCGAPRNDIFFRKNNTFLIDSIKNKLGIGVNYFIVMFAPTFRADFQFQDSGIDINRVIEEVEKKVNKKVVFLYKLHPGIITDLNMTKGNVIDVSKYSDTQELLLISDILISDYSGLMWDFSLMNKPVFIYASDLENYKKTRGLYDFYFNVPFWIAEDNDSLIEGIRTFDEATYQENLKKYFEIEQSYDEGKASQTILKLINEHFKL